jgi:hypothetical protein
LCCANLAEILVAVLPEDVHAEARNISLQSSKVPWHLGKKRL